MMTKEKAFELASAHISLDQYNFRLGKYWTKENMEKADRKYRWGRENHWCFERYGIFVHVYENGDVEILYPD